MGQRASVAQCKLRTFSRVNSRVATLWSSDSQHDVTVVMDAPFTAPTSTTRYCEHAVCPFAHCFAHA